MLTNDAPLSATLADGAATVQVTCSPPVLATQTVQLVLNEQLVAGPPATGTESRSSLSFALQGFTAGSYVVRLRVDGQDSIPVVGRLDQLRPQPEPGAVMTAEAEWEERNNAYLAAGLAWLRGRLAGSEAGEPGGPEQAPWRDGYPDGSEPAEPEPGPALELLGDRLGMSRFERSILLLCAAAEFDPGIAAAWAGGAVPGAGRPTFGLALEYPA